MVSELGVFLSLLVMASSSTTKFDIEKFDGSSNFNLWQVHMLTVLMQQGLKKTLFGKGKKSESTLDEPRKSWMKKPYQLFSYASRTKIPQETLDQKTIACLWNKLESIFFNKISHQSVEAQAITLHFSYGWRCFS